MHDVAKIERLVCESWLRVPRALNAVPEPRAPFANAGRRDNAYRPWRFVLEPIGYVSRAARATGDRAVIEATREQIADFFDTMKAHALAALPAATDGCLTTEARTVAREVADAIDAGLLAAHAATLPNVERFAVELREAGQAIGRAEHACHVTRGKLANQPVARLVAAAL